MSKICLKCGFDNPVSPSDPLAECPSCRIIYSKHEAAIARKAQAAGLSFTDYVNNEKVLNEKRQESKNYEKNNSDKNEYVAGTPQIHTPEQIAKMEFYAISFDGIKYHIGQHNYDSLEGAVSYAVAQQSIDQDDVTKIENTSSEEAGCSATAHRSDYDAARAISVFISFLGWIIFACGSVSGMLAIIFMGISKIPLLGLGLGIAVSGLFLITAGQVTRATVDNADNTREILKIIKDKS
jgi:hypothetical protein